MTAMLPMQAGSHDEEFFNPVWSSAIPLSPADFAYAIDEINATCKQAYPMWKRRLPLCCVPITFLIVCLSAVLSTLVFGLFLEDRAKEIVAVAVLVATLSIFVGRWLKRRMYGRMLADVRRNLVNLNGRYMGQGVDFQLHESPNLDLYFRTTETSSLALRHQMENGRRDDSFSRVDSSNYILVVQLTHGNAKRIPAPEALRGLRAQAVTKQPQSTAAPLVAAPAL